MGSKTATKIKPIQELFTGEFIDLRYVTLMRPLQEHVNESGMMIFTSSLMFRPRDNGHAIDLEDKEAETLQKYMKDDKKELKNHRIWKKYAKKVNEVIALWKKYVEQNPESIASQLELHK